jgi:hypothetical protein
LRGSDGQRHRVVVADLPYQPWGLGRQVGLPNETGSDSERCRSKTQGLCDELSKNGRETTKNGREMQMTSPRTSVMGYRDRHVFLFIKKINKFN